MTTREVVDTYYRLANAGEWAAWCDLFAEDCVIDEQVGGHLEGLATLRQFMSGMDAWTRFQNVPQKIVVEGDQAVGLSHISAVHSSQPENQVEADVANYYQVKDGRIAYFKNVHDVRPFTALLEPGGE